MDIPECFCWTRFGTEAGQTITEILFRKEAERAANDGIFFWGIGNGVGRGIKELIQRCPEPEILFSPIRSRPRPQDVAPTALAAWVTGETLEGKPFRLPPGSVVTSRFDLSAPKETHYALVCFNATPLSISSAGERIEFSSLRNLVTGRPIGPSQVTAVVRHNNGQSSGAPKYEVAMRTHLAFPYFVRFRHPVAIPRLDNLQTEDSNWATAVRRFINNEGLRSFPQQPQLWNNPIEN